MRVELLRLASGRAGLGGELLEPGTYRGTPARKVLDLLVAHVREALEDCGEYDQVNDLRHTLVRRGDGASLQRAAYARTGRLSDVVTDAIRRTMS